MVSVAPRSQTNKSIHSSFYLHHLLELNRRGGLAGQVTLLYLRALNMGLQGINFRRYTGWFSSHGTDDGGIAKKSGLSFQVMTNLRNFKTMGKSLRSGAAVGIDKPLRGKLWKGFQE